MGKRRKGSYAESFSGHSRWRPANEDTSVLRVVGTCKKVLVWKKSSRPGINVRDHKQGRWPQLKRRTKEDSGTRRDERPQKLLATGF